MDKDTKRNLIVNYLPNSLSQEDVKKIFERLGNVTSCKLVRNKQTGQSLGYAFIEYAEESAAASAVSEITGTEMEGKRIKVSYARSSGEDIKNANVYIANLPPTVTEDKLLELFSVHGTILSHKVLTNQDGTSRGAGFVRYSSNSEAAAAIKVMAGEKLPDSTAPLTVKLAIPAASKKDSHSLNAITNNTLAGVGITARTSNVRYNPMGTQQHQQAMFNPALNMSASPVAAALSGMTAHVAQHSGGVVAASPHTMASVYVFGLQPTHSELTLYELFSPFGAILNVKMVRDLTKEDNPGKGYGFVNFTKLDDALRAVSSMNGVPFEEKVLQVSLKQNKAQNGQSHQAHNPYGNLSIIGMGVAS